MYAVHMGYIQTDLASYKNGKKKAIIFIYGYVLDKAN